MTRHASPLSLLLAVTVCLAGCASGPRPGGPGGPGATAVPSAITTEQAQDIAIHALGLVGTPYRYGGNTVAGGFDCSGLIGHVYRTRVGVTPPRTVTQLAGFGRAVDAGELRTGDLVLFGGARPTHAGIYVGDGRFVHAPSSGGDVRLDRLDGPYWSRQRFEVRRI
jgi:cell wall-associated NlpC family hydrolase